MLKYETVFLDFDETLFKHYEFLEWVFSVLEEAGLVTAAQMLKSVDQYHNEIYPRHRVYRHVDHYREVSGVDWHHVSGVIARAYPKDACLFCYDDAHEMLDFAYAHHQDVRILSFGDEAYQRFKMSFCKKIRDYHTPIQVVQAPKREYFNAYSDPIKKYVLIDDKADLMLPENITHVWINRALKPMSSQSSTKVKRVNSLSSPENYLYR